VPRRFKPVPLNWTPNQIVAFNIAKARLLRGWTQDEAAQAIAPYLGTVLSTASFSAIERSVDVGRVREFNADEIVALARGFKLPIGWFFTPPSVWEGAWVATPDTGDEGLDPEVMMDLVLGTPDTLDDWKKYLFTWPNPAHRFREYADGTKHLGRVQEDVHPRLDEHLRLRFRTLLRHHFGSVEQADEMLANFRAFLADLDDPVQHDPETVAAAGVEPPPPAGSTD
jgi:hypothetical protein